MALARSRRVERRTPRTPVPLRTAAAELLEVRRLLSAAPVAVDDAYDLGPDGRLAVDVSPSPGRLAFDESPSRWPAPTGPFTVADFVRRVEGGATVTEPATGPVVLGDLPGAYGEATVRNPGSTWTVPTRLELGREGKGTISVTDGGHLVTGNDGTWVGSYPPSPFDRPIPGSAGGLGEVTISGPGSRWDGREYLILGHTAGRGTLRVADHATVAWRENPNILGSAALMVGWFGGSGAVEVLDGARFNNGGGVLIANDGSRGVLRIAGGAVMDNRDSGEYSRDYAMVATRGGSADVTISGPGSAWHLGNWMELGLLDGSRADLRVEDGGLLAIDNWLHIGNWPGSSGRLSVTGSGSRLEVGNFMTIAETDGEGTLFVGEGATVSVRGTSPGAPPGHAGPRRLTNRAGGRIYGAGTVEANIHNFGLVSPGGSTGVLTLDGDYTNSAPWHTGPGGTTRFDIAGRRRGDDYDALDVAGRAEFNGGRVVLNFVDGFAPSAGDRFELVDAETLYAAPAPGSVEVRGLAEGFRYSLAVDGQSLVLTATNDGVAATQQPPERKGVLANDVDDDTDDSDGDALTAVLASRPRHGTVTLYRDGSFHYAPGPTFGGTDTFSYFADDGVYESNVATVTVRNPAPVARDDAYSTDEDVPLNVPAAEGVLANDTDPNNPTLAAVLVDFPDHGELELLADGSFTYTPDASFQGTDSFTYRAHDPVSRSEPATVTITVRGANDAPVARPDSKTTRQGQALRFNTSDLLANDADPDGDRLTVTAVSATADTHGTVSLSDGRVTYRPDRDYTGPARFTYTVSDGRGGTATGVVNVTVTPRHRGTPGTVVARGTLDGRQRSFSMGVTGRSAGGGDDLLIRGLLSFEDRRAGVDLRSTDIHLLSFDRDGKTATVAGTATVNGRGGYAFEATAEDRSASGHNDRFRIVITGPALAGGEPQFHYDSATGSTTAGRIDRGGNVVIIPSRRGNDDEDDN